MSSILHAREVCLVLLCAIHASSGLLLSPSVALSPTALPRRLRVLPLAAASVPSPKPAASLTDSPGWPALQRMLDALPVFAVANEEGQPVQYTLDGETKALFYADVSEAAATAKEQFPELKCDLLPIGLGQAYLLCCEGKADLVPGTTELRVSGMPTGMSAVGQELPFFACTEMAQETEAGEAVLPLFMSYHDCQAAIKQARDADGDAIPLEIIGLSLPSVIEQLSSMVDDGSPPAFAFIAPSRSIEHINEKVASPPESPAPAPGDEVAESD